MYDWDRKTQIVVLVLIGALLFGGGYKYAKRTAVPEIEVVSEEADEKESSSQVTVHVAGAVEKPGVYVFEAGGRVNDAVNKAVPLPEADLDMMNLAAVLEDGKRIEVPAENSTGDPQIIASAGGIQGKTLGEGGKININSASPEQLDTLPGIGPAYAERIIAYREEHGGFSSIEELQDIAGIGPKTYERLKDMVCIY